MDLKLSQVRLRGGGWSFHNDDSRLSARFEAPFSMTLAKTLGCESLVYKSKSERRSFRSVVLCIGYESPQLSIVGEANAPVITIDAHMVRDFKIEENKDNALVVTFQVRTALDNFEMIDFIKNQRREPAYEMTILGRQKELEFGKPGRPKKNKDENEAKPEAA